MTICQSDDQARSPSIVDSICDLPVEAHLEPIRQTLPRGRAWEMRPGSTMEKYWLSFATMMKHVTDRTCNLLDEFYCSTATETVEVWAEQYGIAPPEPIDYTNPCLKPEYLLPPLFGQPATYSSDELCGRVTAQGGATCQYFTDVALTLGWVITCEIPDPVANAGCSVAGCAMLGPPPVPITNALLGWGKLDPCFFGRAIDHPDGSIWDVASNKSKAMCPVPGSCLGKVVQGPDCCYIVGYYEREEGSTSSMGTQCTNEGAAKVLTEPTGSVIVFPNCYDSTGNFLAYGGNSNTVIFNVDMQASATLQAANSAYEPHWVVGGCYYVGDPCNPLRRLFIDKLQEFMGRIVPAHVSVIYKQV